MLKANVSIYFPIPGENTTCMVASVAFWALANVGCLRLLVLVNLLTSFIRPKVLASLKLLGYSEIINLDDSFRRLFFPENILRVMMEILRHRRPEVGLKFIA